MSKPDSVRQTYREELAHRIADWPGRLIVLGAGGMLGRRVLAAARRRGWETWALTRWDCDVATLAHVAAALDALALQPPVTGVPVWVVNCAGVLPARGRPPVEMVAVNALGPYNVAHVARTLGLYVLHVSTDCVFSGTPDPRWPGRRYTPMDCPDPRDLYGRTKAAGEVHAPHVTNVRTSFIGPEHGLQAWFAGQAREGTAEHPAEVDGWTEAWWTGGTASAVASALCDMVASGIGPGIHQLAGPDKLSKFQVLGWLADRLGVANRIQVRPAPLPRLDRALEATWALPALAELEPDGAVPVAVRAS